MAAVSIRDLDEQVRDKLRIRAARHGRSMEAEIRAILSEAVDERPAEGLAQSLMSTFSGRRGLDIEIDVRRHEPPRAPTL